MGYRWPKGFVQPLPTSWLGRRGLARYLLLRIDRSLLAMASSLPMNPRDAGGADSDTVDTSESETLHFGDVLVPGHPDYVPRLEPSAIFGERPSGPQGSQE